MTDNVIELKIERICATPGCGKLGQHMGSYRKDGTPQRRNYCSTCHGKRVSKKHGLTNMAQVVAKNAGFGSAYEYLDHKAREQGFANYGEKLDARARKKGFKNYTEYTNSKHPYLKYRKDYCENRDGSRGLGFNCTTTIVWEGMLDVDHIDGDPSNNDPINLQTLCKCCHAVKTNQDKDWLTPGRKAMGIKY